MNKKLDKQLLSHVNTIHQQREDCPNKLWATSQKDKILLSKKNKLVSQMVKNLPLRQETWVELVWLNCDIIFVVGLFACLS